MITQRIHPPPLRRWAAIVAFAGMCNSPSASVTTGLTGTALRGPITPVCQENVPCDGPLTARFDVLSAGSVIGAFRSDEEGKFLVRLPPGVYSIRPAANAPIMNPATQVKTVTVNPEGLTEITLSFDTGIR
jgi:hypothetical protein